MARAALCTQVAAILRKNWILQKKNQADLVREILWPIVLLIALVSIR